MIFDSEEKFNKIAAIANGALTTVQMCNRTMKFNFLELVSIEIRNHLAQYKIDSIDFNDQYDRKVANGVYVTGLMRYISSPMEYHKSSVKLIKIENHRSYDLFTNTYFTLDRDDFHDIIRADKVDEVMKSFKTVIGGAKSYRFRDNINIDLQLTLVELLMYKITLIKDIWCDISSILCKLRDAENNIKGD